LGAGPIGAGGELLEHLAATGATEGVKLGFEVLILGRRAGIADQGHWQRVSMEGITGVFSHMTSSDETIV
jgi:hypothetical protein